MKISEAQSKYRAYRQDLINQTSTLIKKRDEMQEKYRLTGSSKFSEQAASLQLSINETKKKFDKNQEILDSLTEQYAAVWNAEVAGQQADSMEDMGEELSKLITVAQRIASGARVPYSDEKKLMEYSPDLYQIAKSAQMLNRLGEPETYDSLWDDEGEVTQEYDPQGKAENAEAQGELPEIPKENVLEDFDLP